MGYNFDDLPDSKPAGGNDFPLLAEGIARAKVASAKVVNKTAEGGSKYLEVVLDCTDSNGVTGKVWDRFVESDKDLPKYKLRQFLVATNKMLKGNFELEDLTKIIVGNEFYVALKVVTPDNPKYKTKNEVDAFDDEIYTAIDKPVTTFNAPDGGAEASTGSEAPFDTGNY
jgi:hypothetical protein